MKYKIEEISAVIPIIKLLVVVLTFIGKFIIKSIPKTFNIPEPIPNKPETKPDDSTYFFNLFGKYEENGKTIYYDGVRWIYGYINSYLKEIRI